jgi:hypothetical protein
MSSPLLLKRIWQITAKSKNEGGQIYYPREEAVDRLKKLHERIQRRIFDGDSLVEYLQKKDKYIKENFSFVTKSGNGIDYNKMIPFEDLKIFDIEYLQPVLWHPLEIGYETVFTELKKKTENLILKFEIMKPFDWIGETFFDIVKNTANLAKNTFNFLNFITEYFPYVLLVGGGLALVGFLVKEFK